MSSIKISPAITKRLRELCPYRRDENVKEWIEKILVRAVCFGVSLQVGTGQRHDIPTAAIRTFSEFLDAVVDFLPPEDADRATANENKDTVRWRLRTGLVCWIHQCLDREFTNERVSRYVDILFSPENDSTSLDAICSAAEAVLTDTPQNETRSRIISIGDQI